MCFRAAGFGAADRDDEFGGREPTDSGTHETGIDTWRDLNLRTNGVRCIRSMFKQVLQELPLNSADQERSVHLEMLKGLVAETLAFRLVVVVVGQKIE